MSKTNTSTRAGLCLSQNLASTQLLLFPSPILNQAAVLAGLEGAASKPNHHVFSVMLGLQTDAQSVEVAGELSRKSKGSSWRGLSVLRAQLLNQFLQRSQLPPVDQVEFLVGGNKTQTQAVVTQENHPTMVLQCLCREIQTLKIFSCGVVALHQSRLLSQNRL